MKKIDDKPKLRPKELRKHLLTTASNLHVGGYGKLDAKNAPLVSMRMKRMKNIMNNAIRL